MTRKRGDNVKLTVEVVRAIKDGLHDGLPGATLAAAFDISEAAVSLIKHNLRWPEVQATHEKERERNEDVRKTATQKL